MPLSLFFLSAAVPLTKTYSMVNDTLKKTPYPQVYKVTSHEERITDLSDFYAALQKHAAKKHCLLKGALQRPLINESRAGSTLSGAATQWICLDIDGVSGFKDLNTLLKALNLDTVSHIVQWSAGAFLNGDTTLRAHVFMLLEESVSAPLLKPWLMSLNLNTPEIEKQIQLSRTGNALRWPIDITTCQNDKLIYIAPPILMPGVVCALKSERIQLIRRRRDALCLTEVPALKQLQPVVTAKLNALRAAAGMEPRKSITLKITDGIEYLPKPNPATITEIKNERGFVYFNLNGGDSWGYYHPESNPTYIYNFKGEPVYLTKELLPDYWKSLQDKAINGEATRDNLTYLAFRDFKSAAYYNGIYNNKTNELDIAQARNETQLRDFMKQHGQVLGDWIPVWNLVFDPHSDFIIDKTHKRINTYVPSPYLRQTKKAEALPRTVDKIISHMLADDGEVKEHFLNWLACIYQYKQAIGLAWGLHGIQGTGKGLFIHRIIAPTLGHKYVALKRMAELEEDYTDYIENKFIVFFDEVQISESRRFRRIMSNLKNLITEPTVSVRKMYHKAYTAPNFANFIFASNMPDPLVIEDTDRRFNFGNYQSARLQITTDEVERQLPDELAQFVGYIMHREADLERARTILDNQARRDIIELSHTSVELTAKAIREGDLETLWDAIPDPNSADTTTLRSIRAERAVRLLRPVIEQNLTESRLSRDDIRLLFEICVDNVPQEAHKFTLFAKHHGIDIKKIRIDGLPKAGAVIRWHYSAEWATEMRAHFAKDRRPLRSIK